jgi:hypothetical protein
MARTPYVQALMRLQPTQRGLAAQATGRAMIDMSPAQATKHVAGLIDQHPEAADALRELAAAYQEQIVPVAVPEVAARAAVQGSGRLAASPAAATRVATPSAAATKPRTTSASSASTASAVRRSIRAAKGSPLDLAQNVIKGDDAALSKMAGQLFTGNFSAFDALCYLHRNGQEAAVERVIKKIPLDAVMNTGSDSVVVALQIMKDMGRKDIGNPTFNGIIRAARLGQVGAAKRKLKMAKDKYNAGDVYGLTGMANSGNRLAIVYARILGFTPE